MPETRTSNASHTGAAATPPAAALRESSDATKLLVAVHGIGDQTAYATIQSVALRVSTHRGRMIATPLGRFYREAASTAPVEATPQLMSKQDGVELENIVLAETYWAPIPREVAAKKFVLEDTKEWGRSIAARVAYNGDGDSGSAARVERLVAVLDELVETIGVLDRLTFLAEKAGVFKFDLAQLLVDFVGDVQLVADFPRYRDQIIDRFDETMCASIAAAPKDKRSEVYIIAHSEGTVIAFLALLEALNDPGKYPWISNVCGLMTIGSPIEVHHLLWPGLWQYAATDGHLKPSSGVGDDFTIPWHNYMDYGDPIAYELTETTKWLQAKGFAKHLEPTTHAFSRYPLPGKAHVDYWADAEVFGHFFDTVVKLPRKVEQKYKKLDETVTQYVNRVTTGVGAIRTHWWVPTLTFVLPYALVAILLFGAVYAIEHAVGSALHADYPVGQLARDVVGIGLLMFGVTAAVRLPRIADGVRWTFGGWGILAVTMVLFALIATPGSQRNMGAQMVAAFGFDPAHCAASSAVGVSMGCASGGGLASYTLAIWILAAVVTFVSGFAAKRRPRSGHYLLPAFGVVAAFFVAFAVANATPPAGSPALNAAAGASPVVQAGSPVDGTAGAQSPSLWPILLGGLAFFYLWWLSGMLFDLAFIWRRYTRDSGIREHLSKLVKPDGPQAGATAG